MLAAHCMAAARKTVVESMIAPGFQAARRSADPVRCGVRSDKEELKRCFAGYRTLWRVVILPGFKQDQFAGDGNTGRQDNIQAGLTVMGKGHTDFCPVRIFVALQIRLSFLGDIGVINGFSHDAPFNEMVRYNIFDHIPILHSGFNGSARTFSGTLNCGCVSARPIFLKSNTRPGRINVQQGNHSVMVCSA